MLVMSFSQHIYVSTCFSGQGAVFCLAQAIFDNLLDIRHSILLFQVARAEILIV